jgi:protein-L-isoaspartate(D-aspartate) O-methyltransferase
MTDADLQAAKDEMLRSQLRQRGIHDQRVLEAMGTVPRERFVPADLRANAYGDRALPIDCSQTISQPYIVALMTEALELSGDELVLEVGTGSGYQTAILARLAHEVVSIERHAALTLQAEAALAELGCSNVTLLTGDGTLGWPPRAPYDCIMVTAAAAECPPPLLAQLAEGGRMVIPLGDRESQVLQLMRKQSGRLRITDLSSCRFVPLIGEQGWSGE